MFGFSLWERYWGLIACSSFGEAARSLVERAKQLAEGDEEPLVRTRAAEFLGLIGAADPRPVLMDVLASSRSGVEANLILNTLVLLRDGRPGYEFTVTPDHLDADVRNAPNVARRMEYLQAENRRHD